MSCVGDEIKKRRESVGISQNQLAKRAGCAQSTLSAIEKSTKKPSTETLRGIAGALGCTVAELMGEAPESDGTITDAERRLLRAWRAAEDAARRMALDLLESHPAEIKNEIRA